MELTRRMCAFGLSVQASPRNSGEYGVATFPATPQARSGRNEASCGQDDVTEQGMLQFSWQEFLANATLWWDKSSKTTPCHPDFKHGVLAHVQRLNIWYNAAWVSAQVALWDSSVRKSVDHSPLSARTSPGSLTERECKVEIATCRKLCESGQTIEVVDVLNRLVKRGCHIPNNIYYRVLKWCILRKDFALGKHVHALIVKSGYGGNAFLATHLIGLYSSHGELEEATRVFSSLKRPSVYNWAAIILAYARHEQHSQAIALYRQMREAMVEPGNGTFVTILKACASAGDLAAGKDVHAHILGSAGHQDILVQTCVVDMYAKCGSLEHARTVFDELPRKDVVAWTAMIAGYAQRGMGHEALDLYSDMQREGSIAPNSVTFASLLQACASAGAALHQGKQLHAQIEEQGLEYDMVVGSSLVNMYAKCGGLDEAREVFDKLPHKNVVTWTGMITGYVQKGMGLEALDLYSNMQQAGLTPPDAVTFVCLLQASAIVGAPALHQGKQLHAQIQERGVEDDVAVGASLVSMYAKCGCLANAHEVFQRLPHKNLVTWNAMISGYAQRGLTQEAFSLYRTMQQQGLGPPDSFTYVCLLQACANAAALPLGVQLHAELQDKGLQSDVLVGSCLVNMYAKCGKLEEAQAVFESLLVRDVVAWSSLIAAYTRQGHSDIVFDLVDRMRQDGVHPNSITFLSVLTACSHEGLVEKGRTYFKAMTSDYGISPTMEHYACMTDLLGRAGHLSEALLMASTMPFEPNGKVWITLLGACQMWGSVEVGRQAFENAVSLDEKNAAPYVLMSNIYAAADMWEEAKEMQARRVKLGAWKNPGHSWWTDKSGVMHTFLVGDGKLTGGKVTYAKLEELAPFVEDRKILSANVLIGSN